MPSAKNEVNLETLLAYLRSIITLQAIVLSHAAVIVRDKTCLFLIVYVPGFALWNPHACFCLMVASCVLKC